MAWIPEGRAFTPYFVGSGSPEGVHAAPLGTHYFDQDVTTGALEWVKASDGSLDTGWKVLVGSTAWRDLVAWNSSGAYTYSALGSLSASFRPQSGVAGGIAYRRVQNIITWWIWGVEAAGSVSANSIVDLFVPNPAIPRGLFADDGTYVIKGRNETYGLIVIYSNVTLGARLQLRTNAALSAGSVVFSQDGGIALTHMTTDHWPTTLPGIIHSGTPTP